jgi:hypothetical protein
MNSNDSQSGHEPALRGQLALLAAGLAASNILVANPAKALTAATPITAYFSTSPGSGAIQIPGTGDVQVVNYALALEDLESALYTQAIARLTTGGTSGIGTTIPGLGITSGQDLSQLQEYGQVEAQHATFLRSALTSAGATTIPVFAYDFGLQNLSRQQVIQLVYAAELHGVSAYEGAIPFFATYTYLQLAAAILGTEARHTAALAFTLNGPLFNQTPAVETAPSYTENQGKDTPLTPDQILYAGGTISPGLTIPPGGTLGPVTGPNGYVYAVPTPQ